MTQVILIISADDQFSSDEATFDNDGNNDYDYSDDNDDGAGRWRW